MSIDSVKLHLLLLAWAEVASILLFAIEVYLTSIFYWDIPNFEYSLYAYYVFGLIAMPYTIWVLLKSPFIVGKKSLWITSIIVGYIFQVQFLILLLFRHFLIHTSTLESVPNNN